MKVLVIGSNGREHALAVKYSESKKTDVIFIAPGNGLTNYKTKKIKNIEIAMTDLDALVRFSKKEKVDLVDVAQDDCLAKGYVDRFQKENIVVFGPTQKASQLEWDKKWARNFMVKYNQPIPPFKSFTNPKEAISYVKKLPDQLLFVKASGLALGKGVIRAENREQAIEAIKAMQRFGNAGKTFLIEEGMVGEEFTLFAIVDCEHYVITKTSQDHKTIFDGDKGPNTGGIGSVSPTSAVTSRLIKEIEKTIIKPTLAGMKKEGRPYSGILYLGGMITPKGVRIVEFNARWGDPEAEVILPSIKTDYLEIVQAVINEKLYKLKIDFDTRMRVSVAGCSRGYPNDYAHVKGKEIFGLHEAGKFPGITIYGAGIIRKGKRFSVNGGRVFHLVAEGDTVQQARVRAYGAMAMISIEGNNLHYRTDIGWRDVERMQR